MTPIKQYMASLLKDKTFHFKCDCLMSFDVVGKVVDYEITPTETVFSVMVGTKLMRIGTNHPNLFIEPA